MFVAGSAVVKSLPFLKDLNYATEAKQNKT